MAAGTETAIDTRQYNGTNYVGNIVEKILLARQLAKNERQFAAKQAEQAGTSLEEAGIKRGHFFRRALAGQFGGNYIDKKKEQLKNVNKKYKIAKRIGKNPRSTLKFIKPLLGRKVSSAQTKMFRAKFDYGYQDNINRPTPQSPIVGSRVKKIQKATGGRSKRVSKEEILSTLTDIVDSLNKTAESIGKTTAGISAGIVSAAKAQVELVEQLKLRNTTLEDKLDQIATAISNQTQSQKRTVAKITAKKQEDKLEAIKDIAKTEVPDDTQTEINETILSQLSENVEPTTNIINAPTIERPAGGYPSFSSIAKPGMDIPQAETGGIISGPDSGYLAKLHGNEMVIPLDNNYTQGEPSAMDGKVRPKPKKLPTYEKGTPKSSVGGRFGFGITNMTGIASGGTTQSSAMAQPLVDAMSLPMMAAGGSILAAVSRLTSSLGSEGENIAPEIEKISRPIADVFGLPQSIVNKTKPSVTGKPGEGKDTEEDGESKKDLLAKMMDGFGSFLNKLGESINTTPPPPPGGTAQPADITGNEKELLKRLMIAEAGGEGIEGMAMVGQSVLNRASLIQSGTVGAGQFNAASGSVTDVIQGKNQYQPYAEGKLNRALSAEENARAEEAYNLLMNMPEFKKRIKQAFNLSDRQVQLGAASTGFRNYDAGAGTDTSQQVNEFRAGRHTFNTAGNVGLRTASSDVKVAQPTTTQQTSPGTATQLGQAITNNYGLQVGEERQFTHPQYGVIKAHKTTKGFDFYRGAEKLNMAPSKPQAKSIVEYFESTNGGRVTTGIGPQASIAPPPGANKQVQTEAIAQEIDSKAGSANFVAMMMPGQTPKMASTSLPSTAESTAASPGTNPILNSGLFNSDIMAT
jgi:regulator of replication initiation timing